MHILASVVERDGVQPADRAAVLEPLQQALREAGLSRTRLSLASTADVASLGSSWAKRLGIPERRPAWFLSARWGD